LTEEKVIAAKLVINHPQLNTLLQSRRNSPNLLLAKLTRDFEKRNELFKTFNLSSPRRINKMAAKRLPARQLSPSPKPSTSFSVIQTGLSLFLWASG